MDLSTVDSGKPLNGQITSHAFSAGAADGLSLEVSHATLDARVERHPGGYLLSYTYQAQGCWVCVRCGEPMSQPLQGTGCLRLLAQDAQAPNQVLSTEDLDTEFLTDPRSFDLTDWFERQIQLDLGEFPRHESCEPALPVVNGCHEITQHRPFADLVGQLHLSTKSED